MNCDDWMDDNDDWIGIDSVARESNQTTVLCEC